MSKQTQSVSLRDELLGVETLVREAVPTPEWWQRDGEIFATALSAQDGVAYAATIVEDEPADVTAAKLLTFTLVDAKGKRIFKTGHHITTDGNKQYVAGDEGFLVKLSGKLFNRLADVAMRLNGIGDGEKELAKN